MSCNRGRGRRPKDDGWESRGGYMNVKKQKLNEQFKSETPYQLQKEGSGSRIFAGVIIHVNGYTKPSSDELKRLMMLHGGNYEHYLARRKVTHVIASNLPDSKVREIRGLKVVRPEWITDSIAAGRLLSYTSYLLYTALSGLQKGLASFTAKSSTSLDSMSSETPSNPDGSLSPTGDHSEFVLDTVPVNKSPTVDSTASVHSAYLNTEKDNAVGHSVEALNGSVSHNVSASVHKPSGQISKAGDPSFLNEYYGNSRLHYLSTWKAEFKNYINELQSKGSDLPGREALMKVVQERERTDGRQDGEQVDAHGTTRRGRLQRCVMHIDMDCFFVSVGLKNRPELKGRPVAVTHSKGRGIPDGADHSMVRVREKEAYRRKREAKAGKHKGASGASVSHTNPGGFPDFSDSDSEDEAEVEAAQVSMVTDETFHSMAEIASCSYEARQAGVRNGMFMGEARRVCPQLVTIPYDFEGYKSVSKILYDTVASYTHDIEAVSCDEMLVDCTDLLATTGATPLEFSTHLRDQIFHRTDCHASAGLSSSILLARLATKKAKPNGQFHLTPDLVAQYIKPLTVKDLPGVGWSLTRKFEAMNVRTCGELQSVSMETLQKEFGPKTGQSMHRYCRGQDDRPIKIEHQRKSVSAEVNYGIRFKTEAEAVTFLQDLSVEVCTRLKTTSMKARTVCLKLMVRRPDAPKETSKFMGHGVCNNMSKSVTLPLATDEERIVGKECVTLYRQMKASAPDLRGIGIQLQKLDPASESHNGNHPSLSKNQSILNFAVNRNPSVESQNQVPSKTSSSDTSAALSALSESPAKSSPPNQGASGHGRSVSVAVSTMAQRESDIQTDILEHERLSVGSSSQLQDRTCNKENIQSPGEVPAVVAHEDLLWDLGQRQTDTAALPPLPCLPDMSPPEQNRVTRQREVTLDNPQSTNRLTTPGEADFFPSPSQVDPEVLKELPADIRAQVEAELKMRRKRAASIRSSSTSQTRTVEPVVAPGHRDLPQTSRQNSTDSVRDPSRDAIVALPSPSQLDPTCLEALPPSMREEIRRAYAQQNGTTSDTGVTGDKVLTVQLLRSPEKTSKNSPRKRSPAKGSPQFKVPRGRPSGRGRKRGSSKKLLFKDKAKTSAAQASLRSANIMAEYDNLHSNSSVVPSVPALPSCSTATAQADFSHVTSTSTDWLPDNVPQTEPAASVWVNQSVPAAVSQSEDHEVSLCGAVSLEDVKCLLKEWILSTAGPQEEDEDILITYLQALVLDKNLEKVDRLLKFMHRQIIHSSTWHSSLKNIFMEIQSLVREMYRARLGSIVI